MHKRLLVAALLVAGCATQQPPARVAGPPPAAPGARTAATIANVWYVPGRAIVCGASAVLSGIIMTLTFGHSYDDAAQIMYGGCSGPWTVQPADVRNTLSRPPQAAVPVP